ncbi:carboxymuconolactone decarboxylase family protein [Nonomuraea typhae]|uniref:carboxymuconolactone decarboxylase family protein n=1 Tax=Nonomuraea typhae TaxID=2603600 RepID=UPI0012FA3189|nr:carboxymuconolactone decarboxylase family protein [Nonomuraea typhae]
MGARIPDANTHLPEIQELAGTMVRAVGNGSVPTATTSLVYLRAGQIVGSTYQVMRHSADLRAAGESEARIAAVATWRDAPYFTDAERAALALTDAVFQPGARGRERVPDDLYLEVAGHFDDKAMATLMMVLASAGFWMNIALINRPAPVPA